jgi:transposase
MILELHRQGVSVSAIARQTGFDRKTVRKYIALGLNAPVYARRDRPRMVPAARVAAPAALGGVPAEILYDRMKTAVSGPAEEGGIAFNGKLLDMAAHYGFVPRACKPYRAKTKGKVERPFGYIRQDFFLAGRFGNLDDLNAQLQRWLADVANGRLHATTRRVVSEAFAEERPRLKPLPAGPYRAVLKLERRVRHENPPSLANSASSTHDSPTRFPLDPCISRMP